MPLELIDYTVTHAPRERHHITVSAQVLYRGVEQQIEGQGNGPIAAFVDAMRTAGWKDFHLLDYSQKAVTKGSAAEAVSFVQIERDSDGERFWGASLDANVEFGSLLAVVSAFNRAQTTE